MLEKLSRVLKRVSQDQRRESVELAKKYGYLPYMIERYFAMDIDVIALLEAFEKKPLKGIRCNTLKSGCSSLKKRLEGRGFKLSQVAWSTGFWVLREPYSITSTPEYLNGLFFVQDPASMLPPQVLDPKPFERVADLASAPGGKLTHLSQLMDNLGTIYAFEKRGDRIPSLIANVQRMGVKNAIILHEDAANVVKYGPFDKILLDAPCTGEGVIAKDPSRKRSRSPKDLLFMHKLQSFLLRRALMALKVGGRLVYSTCSIAVEENEAVIATVMDIARPLDSGPGSPGITQYFELSFDFASKCRRLWPHIHSTEGFFICLLERV